MRPSGWHISQLGNKPFGVHQQAAVPPAVGSVPDGRIAARALVSGSITDPSTCCFSAHASFSASSCAVSTAKVLGHPLGSEVYCRHYFAKVAANTGEAVVAIKRMAGYAAPVALQVAYLQLRYCAEPRVAHLLRVGGTRPGA